MATPQQFIVKEQRTVDMLTDLVIGLTGELDITLVIKGGARSTTRPLDVSAYEFEIAGARVGEYEFELKSGVYNCILDVSGVSPDKQQIFIDAIKRNFPEFAAQYKE